MSGTNQHRIGLLRLVLSHHALSMSLYCPLHPPLHARPLPLPLELTLILTAAVAAQGEQHRALLKAINEAIEALVRAVGADGDAASRGQLSATILKHEHARSQKDRQWFAPFGFDSL